jgi:Tfp pilus assembly protein PilX
MNAFLVVVNVVLLVLTLIVILYARATVNESRRATGAAEETVTKAGEIVGAVRDLLVVARDTASSSETAAVASGQAVEVSRELITQTRAAYEADQLHRRLGRLRAVAGTVANVITEAEHAVQVDVLAPKSAWQSAHQELLGYLLVGLDDQMPKCAALVLARRAPHEVLAAAYEARAEVQNALVRPDGA